MPRVLDNHNPSPSFRRRPTAVRGKSGPSAAIRCEIRRHGQEDRLVTRWRRLPVKRGLGLLLVAPAQAGAQWAQCSVASLTPAKPLIFPALSLDEDGGHQAPACAGATVRGFELPSSTGSAFFDLFPGQQWACAGMTVRGSGVRRPYDFSLYPVRKIHHTATRQSTRKASVIPTLTTTLTSETP